MKFTKLDSAQFGTLQFSSPLEFGPGLNIIAAPNQAGKSTLFTLLEWLLYGVPPRGQRKDQQLLESWTPWDGGSPHAVLFMQPERAGWPELVRLEVPFADFQPRLGDTSTLEDLGGRVTVHRNGSWDIGRLLTGLQREAYLASLYAPQGALDNVLHDDGAPLRRALTADLGEHVEDPQRASLDAALAQLDKPAFALPGVADTPIQLSNLARRLEEQYSMWEGQLDTYEQRYDQLEQILAQREQAEMAQARAQGSLDELEQKVETTTLALAHFRFSEVDRLEHSLREWEPRLKEQPWLESFPDLDGDIKAWRARQSSQADALREHEAKLEDAHTKLQDTRQVLKNNEQHLPLLERREELSTQSAELEAAAREHAKAEALVREHGEVANPEHRQRFEQLDAQLEPHRDALPSLSDYTERRQKLDAAVKQLEEREATLSAAAGRNAGALRISGIVLVLLGIAAAVFGRGFVNPEYIAYIAGAVVLAIGGYLVVLAGKQGSRARDARVELDKAVAPQLTEARAELGRLGEYARRLREKYNISEESWEQLGQLLPEYNSLRNRLDRYAQAKRDADSAQLRISAAWEKVRTMVPDAPEEPDTEWLARRLKLLASLSEKKQREKDDNARVKDMEREQERLRERVGQHREELAQLLEPIGLAASARQDPDSAIRQHDNLASEARKYRTVAELLANARDKAAGLAISRDEHNRKWQALDPARRQQAEKLVPDESAYDQLNRERRKQLDELTQARQEYDRARTEAARLRERVARDEDVLAKREEAIHEERRHREMRQRIRVWHCALELLQGTLAAIQDEYAGNLAPLVSEGLQAVLAQAPVGGVKQATVSGNLALRLQVKGAPAGLDSAELLDRLSMGAQRQLALAVRIAMARALSGEDNTGPQAPLLLDEPLASLDDTRSAEMLSYLGKLAQSHQVLLATCHEQQAQWLLERTGADARMLRLPG